MNGKRWQQLLIAVSWLGCASLPPPAQAAAAPVAQNDFKRLGNIVRGTLRAERLSPLRRAHSYRQHWRHKRQAALDEAENDENADIIPDLDLEQKNLGERLKQRAEELSERFEQMWQSLVATMRDCFGAIERIFGGSEQFHDYDYFNNENLSVQ